MVCDIAACAGAIRLCALGLEPDSKLPIRIFFRRQASHDDEGEGDLQPCERRFHRRLEVF